MNTIRIYPLVVILIAFYLNACTLVPRYSHANKPVKKEGTIEAGVFDPVMRASEVVPWNINSECRNAATTETLGACKPDDPNFIAVAISGGGTRSAIFAAAVLFELERYKLLDDVDVMTCVSGGCITAAYHALSCTEEDKSKCLPTAAKTRRPKWEEDRVYKLLTRNYELRWIGNWFWPDNLLRYWFTYYDRTDIMAETLSDNLYDTSRFGGKPFRFRDLNPRRPNLLISSTNASASSAEQLPFLFSTQQFHDLNSNLARYKIANAVMASSTFPGVFQHVTLKNFASRLASESAQEENPKSTYLHLLDGGTWDNLGLEAVKKVINESTTPENNPTRLLVISIDAFPLFKGKDGQKPDPRDFIDYFVDTNFLDAFDVLLTSVRNLLVNGRKDWNNKPDEGEYFMHLTFTDLAKDTNSANDPENEDDLEDILEVIREVGTDFSVKPYQADCLKRAAQILVRKEMQILHEQPKFSGLIEMPPNDDLTDCSPPEEGTTS